MKTSILENIQSDSSLTEAVEVQQKAATVGFDWDQLDPVFEKLFEEIEELKEALEQSAPNKNFAHIEEELGDVLFVCTNIARHLKIDPEIALKKANEKFRKRFSYLEQRAEELNKALTEFSLEQMEVWWQESKKKS